MKPILLRLWLSALIMRYGWRASRRLPQAYRDWVFGKLATVAIWVLGKEA